MIYLESAEPSFLNNPNVGSIDLPIGSSNDFISYQVTATGFGRTNDTYLTPSTLLMFVSMPVISNEECSTKLPSELITEKKLCTNTADQRSTCPGDSGGGAFTLIDGRRVLVGIASFYVDNCQDEIPAVFTRVTEFVDWIEENFNNPPEKIPLPPNRDCKCDCICETCPSIAEIERIKKAKEL